MRAAVIRAKPRIDPHIPRGERKASAARSAGDRRRRKLMWAAREINAQSINPGKAAPSRGGNASYGIKAASAKAITIPNDDASTADWGDPDGLRRPKRAGAQPERESENSSREPT